MGDDGVDLVAALRECPATRFPNELAATIRRPDDDSARRALAARLRAEGDDWADLIELQLQTAAMSVAELDGARPLVRRQAPVLARHPRLHAAVAGTVGSRGPLRLRRGLVEHARISAAMLAARSAELLALAPLRDLEIFPANAAQLERLGQLPRLSRLRHISLADRELDDDAVWPLLRRLDRLESVAFDAGRITDRTLARLSTAPALRRLSIGDGRHTDRSAAALARLSGLRELSVEGRWFDDAALGELARSSVAGLEGLKVIHGRVGPALRALAASPVAAPLRVLALTRSVQDPNAALALVQTLERLEQLHLDGVPLGLPGVEAICAAEYQASLTRLTLNRVGLDAGGTQALGAATLPRLGWLDLSLNAVGDAGARALAQADFAPRLTRLWIGENGIGPAGLGALVERMPSLVVLELNGNPLGDEGARLLARAPALSRVELLRLSSCGIGPEGAEAIVSSPHLQGAARIALGGMVTPQVQEVLDARRAALDPFLAL